MSDDLNKKIKQITDILGQENIPDNVKGLLSLLANSSSKEEPASQKPAELPQLKEDKDEKNERSDMDENTEMLRKVSKVMDKINTNGDPRVNLLSAIKPFLNSTRQKKLNNCIRMLQMSSVARLLDDHDK